ncbi:hypothetical protein [Medusavirus stheno T3]|uniref:Uncharacterized protein n=1 Tax=Medusavirus stheno T3 TaxID=3069717 RepID=A0A7S7YF19_9VIRU|nr:hypothetical protein QKU73_gp114 [Acanthamoeba castellanii medusavirus]QPB44295.1 hypothetical protein [Medusavirus stheno T3]
MSLTCGGSPAQSIQGVCGRSGYIITPDTTCNHDQDQCDAIYAKDKNGKPDGSRWCASDGNGCCTRVTPPAVNQKACCLGQLDSFEDCGADLCPYSDGCREIVGEHCSDVANIKSGLCQKFCATEANKPFCDEPMRQYCGTNLGANDPLCSCIQAEARNAPIPSCFDAACTARGYRTFDQSVQARNCPAMCGAILSCRAAGTCTITDNTITTYCYDSTNAGGAMAKQLNEGGPTVENKRLLVIGILLLAVILACAAYIFQ